jgi:hypothetical protein
MIVGVIRLESDSSIWRMLYRHVGHLCAIAHRDFFPEHIFYAGYGLDFSSHNRTGSANGASPPSPITLSHTHIEIYLGIPLPKFKW